MTCHQMTLLIFPSNVHQRWHDFLLPWLCGFLIFFWTKVMVPKSKCVRPSHLDSTSLTWTHTGIQKTRRWLQLWHSRIQDLNPRTYTVNDHPSVLTDEMMSFDPGEKHRVNNTTLSTISFRPLRWSHSNVSCQSRTSVCCFVPAVGHGVKTPKISPSTGNERGDIEIKDYVVLSRGEDNPLPPHLTHRSWMSPWHMITMVVPLSIQTEQVTFVPPDSCLFLDGCSWKGEPICLHERRARR